MQQPFLRKFILRTLFLLTPFFLYVVLYVVCDPFKVLRSYASFYDNDAPAWVNLNADYVSTIIYYLCFSAAALRLLPRVYDTHLSSQQK